LSTVAPSVAGQAGRTAWNGGRFTSLRSLASTRGTRQGQAMTGSALTPSRLMIALLSGVALAADCAARDHGQYGNVDPAIREWVQSLTDKTGQGCCATADGYPAEYEWDTVGNRYKVRIDGQWYEVPAEAVVDEPNKLGYATVWYWWSWDLGGHKTYHIR